jgi:hypothetical protein
MELKRNGAKAKRSESKTEGKRKRESKVERNGSVSIKKEWNGRLGRASSYSSTSKDDGNFCKRLGSIRIVFLMCL